MELEAIGNSIETSFDYADGVGLDGTRLEELGKLLIQFSSEIAVFLSWLQFGQSEDRQSLA